MAQTKEKAAGAGLITRRDLVIGCGGVAALAALGGVRLASAQALVRPPGGQDEAVMLAQCIRCQKCYEACPRRVIAPAHMEDGIVEMRTPVMSFESNYCDFCAEENGGVPLCAEACPSGALARGRHTDPMSIVLGVARIDTATCLAYRATGCRFCYDACPFDAIAVNDMGQVSVVADRCNGCGACESVCVSLKEGSARGGTERRAISVWPVGEGGTL